MSGKGQPAPLGFRCTTDGTMPRMSATVAPDLYIIRRRVPPKTYRRAVIKNLSPAKGGGFVMAKVIMGHRGSGRFGTSLAPTPALTLTCASIPRCGWGMVRFCSVKQWYLIDSIGFFDNVVIANPSQMSRCGVTDGGNGNHIAILLSFMEVHYDPFVLRFNAIWSCCSSFHFPCSCARSGVRV